MLAVTMRIHVGRGAPAGVVALLDGSDGTLSGAVPEDADEELGAVADGTALGGATSERDAHQAPASNTATTSPITRRFMGGPSPLARG